MVPIRFQKHPTTSFLFHDKLVVAFRDHFLNVSSTETLRRSL